MAAVDAAVAPFDNHQGQGTLRGPGTPGEAALLGTDAQNTGIKTLPPAYQTEPRKPAAPAATLHAAVRSPALNGDLPDAKIHLPGAPSAPSLHRPL